MRFEHVYDDLDRRIETHVDDAEWFVAPQCEQPDNRAVNRVSRLAYLYRPDGLLTGVTAFTRSAAYAEVADLPECTAEPPPGDEYVLADHLFDYDGFGNLTREVQSHGAPADENAPAISYEWDFAGASAGNRNRLSRMIYPKPGLGGGGREVSFVYGESGSVDEALDRVTKIDDDGWGELAKYTYMGLSRRVALMLAGVVTHSVAAGGAGAGYPGLDRFGRLTDLHYQLNAQDTIHRYQYGYDLAGNRTFARITQAPTRAMDGSGQPIEPPQWVPHVNDRSWLYAYDGLNRLIDAGLGSLDDFNAGLLTGGTGLPGGGTAPVPGTTEWSLDNLGNWAGGELGGSGPPVSVLLTGDFDGDGTADDDRTLHHDVNLRNQITGLTEQGESGGPVVHDPAGNVVLHGEYYYQFDAFNRLVQVNLLGEAQVNAADGRIASGALGDLVAQYMYDGLGRLMAKRTPERLSSPKLQTKDYYYDGVRRVMEVITRHGVPPEPGRNDELKEREGEGGGEGEGGEDPPGLPPLPVVEQWVDREYVYGPDYVDEFVAQFDRDGRPMLMLQDGNFNVVALVAGADDVFFDASTNAVPAGSVLEQYVYDPYGGVRQADAFAEHAVNRVGHQGLFFDRFDGDWEHAGLAPGAVGLYYNRNRFYSPPSLRNLGDAENPDWRLVGLGRFISADPNDTALTLVSALAMNGQSLGGPDSSGFNLEGHYGDGFNLYQYLGSNPANSRDPLGLNWGMDDDIDDAIADRTGHAIYSLSVLNESARVASIGLKMTLEIVGSFLPGAGIYDAFQAVILIRDGKGGFWEALDIATAAFPVAKGAAKMLGLKSMFKVRRWRAAGCRHHCLVGGSMVLTTNGYMPIESVSIGTELVSRAEATPHKSNRVARVNHVFKRLAPVILWLGLANGEVLGLTPDHEVWSFENGWASARELQVGDALLDVDGRPVEVLTLDVDATPTWVYNLDVGGTETYFAATIWVHNTKSCPVILPLNRNHGGALHQQFGQERLAAIQKMEGVQGVRWNQALVNSKGQKISNLRPDIQYISVDGKVHIEEIIVSNEIRDRAPTLRALLGADFGSYNQYYP